MTTMTAITLNDDFRAMRARFHRALAVSVGVHALLALTLTLLHEARPVVPRIIEVTWLEPEVETVVEPIREPVRTLPEEPPPVAAPRPRPEPKLEAERPRVDAAAAASARREAQLAGLKATRNEVARDLNVAPASSATRQLLAAAPTGGADLTRMAAGAMMPVAEKGRPVALSRGPEVKASALALNRGPAVVGGGLPLAAEASAGGGGPASAQPAVASGESGAAPGDILLEGPAADRPVVASKLPQYPDWARRQAVEAVVTLHFSVLPDGRVREDVQVLKTGGFRDFDERAVAALRQWRFSALPDGDAGGQWGTITFRFRLHG